VRRRGEDSKERVDDGYTVLPAEFKTASTVPDQNLWYRETRGVQTATAKWSGCEANPGAPALLLSPHKFKLLLLVQEKGRPASVPLTKGHVSGNARM
jgi:hypothetical protein